MVIITDACPSCSWISLKLTPSCTSQDAQVCRRSWKSKGCTESCHADSASPVRRVPLQMVVQLGVVEPDGAGGAASDRGAHEQRQGLTGVPGVGVPSEPLPGDSSVCAQVVTDLGRQRWVERHNPHRSIRLGLVVAQPVVGGDDGTSDPQRTSVQIQVA